jgi:hypothetical protein
VVIVSPATLDMDSEIDKSVRKFDKIEKSFIGGRSVI